MLKMNSAGLYFLRLLFWKNGIFHALANSKLQRGLSWNLNRFAGRGISAFTGFSLGLNKQTKTKKNKHTKQKHNTNNKKKQNNKKNQNQGSLHSCGFRDVVDYFRLGHALLTRSGFGRHSLV